MSLVRVSEYDPEWPRTFERIRAVVWPAVQHAAMSLEHVGSTSTWESYIAGKTEFILGILRQIGLTGEELATLRGINQPKDPARSPPRS